MLIFNKWMIVSSFIFFILCVLAPVRKTALCRKSFIARILFRPHALYGVLFLITTLIHGILSGKQPGMVSGKITWMCLLIFLGFAACKRKQKRKNWIWIHRGGTILLCGMIVIHIIHAVVW